ncbi:rhomboid family intramembrane serine protease [Flavihumibacter sp. R14]|nr:rhomboid family intramembrane serine protease [Flavihumibacter soli]
MPWRWGYSPKTEKYIPLADFPADRYLVVALKVIENLGWSLSHVSESGIIAYTSLSWQSYSEEVSIRISANFAIVKSECVGIQMLFNDYGKNELNLQKFFDEFEYAEFHLKDSWDENLKNLTLRTSENDDSYFNRAPLAAKEKIKNVLYLFYPRKGYLLTPIIVSLNILYWLISFALLGFRAIPFAHTGVPASFYNDFLNIIGANNRYLALSGEYWRLFTAIFIHITISHLFSNMYALVYIGLMTENKIGSRRFLAIYILSGLAGSANSLLFHPSGYMIGASGAIMGMFGAFLALLLSSGFEKHARKAMFISTALVIALMLLNGFSKTGVDNAAHIGGLISGFVIGVICQYELNRNSRSLTYKAYSLAGLLSAVYIAGILYLTPNYEVEKFEALVAKYVENEFSTNSAFNYTYGTTKKEKLRQLQKEGVNVWKSNVDISAKMRRLYLPADAKRKAIRLEKIARLQHQSMIYLYREADEETTKYRGEINRITKKMNEVLKAGNDDLPEGDSYFLNF